MCWLCLVCITATVTHLTSRQDFGIFIEVIDVGAEGLEVWDNKLLPEGLGEQNDVALNTSRTGEKTPKRFRFVLWELFWIWASQASSPQLTPL